MIEPGQEAVSKKYGAAVWDWIEFAPDREADMVRVYARDSAYAEEMAQNRYNEVRRNVTRAARDETFALSWGRRIVASGEMHDDFRRLSFAEKLARADEQDYQDALIRYRSHLEDGRFEEFPEPALSRRHEHRAFKQVQSEYLASLEGVGT